MLFQIYYTYRNMLLNKYLTTFDKFRDTVKGAIAIILCGLVVFGYAAEVSAGDWHDASLTHDGLKRYYRIYIPNNLQSPAPLVILLHGGTQSMNKIFRRKAGATREWPALAEKQGFILMAPNGVNPNNGDTKGDKQFWNDCRKPIKGTGSDSVADDVGFVSKLIDLAVIKYNADPNRIYATGASNGGMMAYRVATELSDQVAAIAVMIAQQPVASECRKPKYPIAVMMIISTDDPLTPWEGGLLAKNSATVLSAEDTLQFWLQNNKSDIEKVKTTALADKNKKDKSTVIKSEYPPQKGGKEVWFFKVVGGGHTIPSKKHQAPRWVTKLVLGSQNKDIEAAEEVWKFFQRHQL